jgi:DNA segregation ATPase FtsK/SpoIIIE-like protein
VSREGGVVERWRGAAIYGKTMSRPTTSGAAMVTGAAGGGGRVSGDLTRTKDRPDWLPGRLLLDRSSGGGRRRQGGPTSAKAMALRFERHGRTASPRAHPDRRRLPTPPLGAQITFEPLWVALDDLPHLLVGGTTGSGKSVFLRSLLWQFTHLYMPSDLDLVVIDAKGMSDYLDFSRAPHIKSGDDFHLGVDGALDLLGEIVETRLPARTRAFSSYARKALDREAPRHLTNLREVLADAARYGEEAPVRPVVVVIDEFAELVLASTDRRRFETLVTRFNQTARAVGGRLIAATQRPSADVVTGLMKSNFARLALRTQGKVDSRVILDENGAEALLGKGDLLYRSAEQGTMRLQGYSAVGPYSFPS